jgi:hypothetical protein
MAVRPGRDDEPTREFGSSIAERIRAAAGPAAGAWRSVAMAPAAVYWISTSYLLTVKSKRCKPLSSSAA